MAAAPMSSLVPPPARARGPRLRAARALLPLLLVGALTGSLLGGCSAASTAPRSAPDGAPDAPSLTLLLVRHAEKATEPAGDPPLTAAGARRAEALASMIADLPLTAVYATQYRRTRETVTPAARAHGLEIRTVDAGDFPAIAATIRGHLSSGSSSGGSSAGSPGGSSESSSESSPVLLMAGHSNTLGPIAQALGAPDPGPIADDDYSDLYVLTVTARGARLLPLRYPPLEAPP